MKCEACKRFKKNDDKFYCPKCEKLLNPDIEKIHNTKAYEMLDIYCDDERGGNSDNCMMADKWDRRAVVNLIISIIQKEIKRS